MKYIKIYETLDRVTKYNAGDYVYLIEDIKKYAPVLN